MSFTEPETQALSAIADGLAGSDPPLASTLTIFNRLACLQRITPRGPSRVARERSAGELADHYVAGSWRGTDAPWFFVAAPRSRPGSRATYLVCHKLPTGDGRISGLAGCWDSRLRDWAATCGCRCEALASASLTLGTILAELLPESWASMRRAGNGPAARADAKGSSAWGRWNKGANVGMSSTVMAKSGESG
jgi:hypothetical protein